LIIVKHRPDNLLQKSVAGGVPEDAKGTMIETVTLPVHKALLQFLNAGLVGSHASEKDLAEFLEEWPGYAKVRGVDAAGAAKDFAELRITKQNTIAAASGMGGNFEIALIERV
jgi:hypothetical protein